MEIAAGKGLVAEQQRIVADRIGLDLERPGGVADQVERRAHHLRLAAEAVGVLHPVAIVVAVADGAPPSRPRSTAATSICPGWPRAAWMRASKGTSLPFSASVDSAPATSAAPKMRSAVNRTSSAIAVETWVPLISASPSFGPSASGSSPSPPAPRRRADARRRARSRPRRSAPRSYGRAARGRPRRRPSPGSG